MFVTLWEVNNPVRRFPRAAAALVAANVAVYLGTIFLPSFAQIVRHYGFTPARHEWLTVVTSMFLHAGFWHLLGNMIFLWMFGDNVEEVVGPWLFVLLYLIGGVGATAMQWAMGPQSRIPCLGASGAISAVVGTYIMLFPKARFELAVYLRWTKLWSTTTNACTAACAWFGEQALFGLITTAAGVSLDIAFWAHVGGLATGVGTGLLLWAVGLRPRPRAVAGEPHPTHPAR